MVGITEQWRGLQEVGATHVSYINDQQQERHVSRDTYWHQPIKYQPVSGPVSDSPRRYWLTDFWFFNDALSTEGCVTVPKMCNVSFQG
jgi:hypothetical protein